MEEKLILNIKPLGTHWETQDPFIFCAYHHDKYPAGNGKMGPAESLAGRNIGQDFAGKDGWNMYHGSKTPGFPSHPHRGFETVSIVRQGTIDHSDSVGGSGRFKAGDVQWLTSGKGVQHAEMFPLLDEDKNPLEMFQIWLNLPKRSKFVAPHYKMLWREDIPVITEKDSAGNSTTIDLIAGKYKSGSALDPTPDSWAADEANEVQIWTIKMAPHAKFSIEATKEKINRGLYFYSGSEIKVQDKKIPAKHGLDLASDQILTIENGDAEGYFLFLQGKPINEPIAQYGPFVMNSEAEIRTAIADYQRTHFGGWPWQDNEPVHDISKGRFAKYPDGKFEEKN